MQAFNDRGYFSRGDYLGDLTSGLDNQSYSTVKSVSETELPINPDDLLKRPDWKEPTHPDAKKIHRTKDVVPS